VIFRCAITDQHHRHGFQLSGTIHYVLSGGAVAPLLGAVYTTGFPNLTGRSAMSRLGRWHLSVATSSFNQSVPLPPMRCARRHGHDAQDLTIQRRPVGAISCVVQLSFAPPIWHSASCSLPSRFLMEVAASSAPRPPIRGVPPPLNGPASPRPAAQFSSSIFAREQPRAALQDRELALNVNRDFTSIAMSCSSPWERCTRGTCANQSPAPSSGALYPHRSQQRAC